MSKDEVTRKTETIDKALGEVLAGSDTALAAVAKAVRDVNETLAIHAAWTEERFEAVDDRLVSLTHIQVMTSGKVEMQIAGIDSHLLGFGVSQSAMEQALSMLAKNHADFLQGHVAICQKAERLEQDREALRQGLGTIVESIQGLTARVAEVLAHAISEEMKQHMAKPAS